MQQLVASAAQIFRSHPDDSDDEILKRLIDSGVERPVATQLVALLPLAYERVTLSDTVAALPDMYVCLGGQGQRDRKGSLSDLPLWAEVINFARQDGEPSFPIASRSAEIRAANVALQDGKKLADLVWGPPVFLWPIDSSAGKCLESKKTRWWTRMWNSPAVHSVSRGDLIMARIAMIIGILMGLLAVGLVAYYSISLLRDML